MGKDTSISWCDATFNPWWGCSRVSEGCRNCYAETFTHRMGLDIWGPTERRFFGDKHWNEPLKWNKEAALSGVKRRVFCASMADVFEIFPGLDEQRARLWALVKATPYLEWLILTKRPENISTRIPTDLGYPSSNVRLGVTAEDQANADKRIPELLRAWQGKNFISYEPAIGPIDFEPFLQYPPLTEGYKMTWGLSEWHGIDWIICGGESGSGCRPMDHQWARYALHQCRLADVPFFFKQIGGFPDKRHTPSGWPEDLRVQEFPE